MSSDSETVHYYDTATILRTYDPKQKLQVYFDLLKKENQRLNLVSRETSEHGLLQLAAESIFPLSLIDRAFFSSYLDIGSGGGFPSIPIILTGAVAASTLVERTQKKAAAVRRMLLSLGFRARIEPVSFEESLVEPGSYDLITMRLVRLTGPMLAKIGELLTDDGVFLHWNAVDGDIKTGSYEVSTVSFAPDGSSDIHTVSILSRK